MGAKKEGRKGVTPRGKGYCCGKPLKHGKCACCTRWPCACTRHQKK